MNEYTIFEAINLIDDDMIEDALNHPRKPIKSSINKWIALAAALVVITVAGLYFVNKNIPLITTTNTNNSIANSTTGFTTKIPVSAMTTENTENINTSSQVSIETSIEDWTDKTTSAFNSVEVPSTNNDTDPYVETDPGYSSAITIPATQVNTSLSQTEPSSVMPRPAASYIIIAGDIYYKDEELTASVSDNNLGSFIGIIQDLLFYNDAQCGSYSEAIIGANVFAYLTTNGQVESNKKYVVLECENELSVYVCE